jgi:translation initiation factor 2 subunit 1
MRIYPLIARRRQRSTADDTHNTSTATRPALASVPLTPDHPLCCASVSAGEKVLDPYHLSADVSSALLTNIRRRLTPQAIKMRADLEVMCFAAEGIDAIKAALKAGEGKSVEDIQIKIKLVAPPLYVMMTTALDKERGLELLQTACEEIGRIVRAAGGEVNIKAQPRAVSERDDKLLGQLMETLEKQNAEVAGDEPEEDM